MFMGRAETLPSENDLTGAESGVKLKTANIKLRAVIVRITNHTNAEVHLEEKKKRQIVTSETRGPSGRDEHHFYG